MLKLFEVDYKEQTSFPTLLPISTPLGDAILDIAFNGLPLSKISPSSYGEISKKASIYKWHLENVHFELLMVNIDPCLPKGMHVDHCVAFLWRFKTTAEKLHLTLTCRLAFKNSDLKGNPEPGEGLIAQSWNNEKVRVTMGTEDDEYLTSKTKNRMKLPFRLIAEDFKDLIKYLPDGIEVELPSLQKNEEGQVQFIVSWVEKGGVEDDMSTWFAVDINPDKILEKVENL